MRSVILAVMVLSFSGRSLASNVGIRQPVREATAIRQADKNQKSEPKEVIIEKDKKSPIRSSECLERSSSGNCLAEEASWGVQGVVCKEDCLARDSYGSCKLSNTCRYDEGSGCFRKKVCTDIGSFNDCKQWEEEIICK